LLWFEIKWLVIENRWQYEREHQIRLNNGSDQVLSLWMDRNVSCDQIIAMNTSNHEVELCSRARTIPSALIVHPSRRIKVDLSAKGRMNVPRNVYENDFIFSVGDSHYRVHEFCILFFSSNWFSSIEVLYKN
jgi:hypothetical protein